MQISVAIELYGSYDPVETPKPLWGSPGAELGDGMVHCKPPIAVPTFVGAFWRDLVPGQHGGAWQAAVERIGVLGRRDGRASPMPQPNPSRATCR